MTSPSAPLVPPGMRAPFILLTACFAAWGVANNMTDPLVNGFKGIFVMSHFQAALVQSAFYGAYFCLALPAAVLVRRTSYKTGVLVGLALFIAGSLLFFPASRTMVYSHFLAALFVLASGLSILETSCNPYVLSLGDAETATRRLNLAQAFNPLGSNLGLALAGVFILPQLGQVSEAERLQLVPSALRAVQAQELQAVMGPYVGMACVLALLWVLIAVVPMPEASDVGPGAAFGDSVRRLLRNRRYTMGVVAQFFYVGAQISVWTFTLHYVEHVANKGIELYPPVAILHGMFVALHLKPQSAALPNVKEVGGLYLQAALLLFFLFRFVFTAAMRRISPAPLLLALSLASTAACTVVLASPNLLGIAALLLVSVCMSVMFPTIYGLALQGVGQDAKVGGAGLVMAILGGALLPLAQGSFIDRWGAATSYLVPALCFASVAAFAAVERRGGAFSSAQSQG